ncbi:SMI1/KNR4 family protein [Burkholderia multivorans]|uniref:SMI1/KNR4 family protein n=1 Tax=Burkholderia multivorans TaxID=87883 RepID=UPI0012FD8970|nr:SMI1/KNR4 family protein [Burkholderia multivorans]
MEEQRSVRAGGFMIPLRVEQYLSKVGGDIHRTDPQAAERDLLGLGVPPASEFGEFYLKYQGSFISARPIAELLDIEGRAIPAIPDQTDYVRDRYQIPDQYLALTTDESEGMYLYNKEDQAVYDLDIGMLDQFLSGRMMARWPTFNDFLTWYFEETP